jgi:hypothetical protein
MNVEIGGEAEQFPEKEYINGIFLAVFSSQCCLWTCLVYSNLSPVLPLYLSVLKQPVAPGRVCPTVQQPSLVFSSLCFTWTCLSTRACAAPGHACVQESVFFVAPRCACMCCFCAETGRKSLCCICKRLSSRALWVTWICLSARPCAALGLFWLSQYSFKTPKKLKIKFCFTKQTEKQLKQLVFRFKPKPCFSNYVSKDDNSCRLCVNYSCARIDRSLKTSVLGYCIYPATGL